MNFECGYCHRTFVRENAFMKHRCKTMIRAEEIVTPQGQTAYNYYAKWMHSYKRKVPTIQVFTTSRYYTTFFKFADFAKRMDLMNIDTFIRYMKIKDIQPSLWMHDRTYVLYLEYVDNHISPMDRVSYMLNELQDYAEEFGCDISEVLDNMTPNECMDEIRKRVFTPWLLSHMTQFKRMVLRCSSEERKIMEDLIRPPYWKLQFNKQPESVEVIKTIAKEFKL